MKNSLLIPGMLLVIIFLTIFIINQIQKFPAENDNGGVSVSTPNRPSTLEDYWTGKAELTLHKRITAAATGWNAGYEAGLELFEHNGTWYMIHRDVIWQSDPDQLRLVMRRSQDAGNTWSEPIVLVELQPNSPYSIAFTDGDIFYDEQEKVWHLLAQCLSTEQKWNGCHATRKGTDPFGAFEMNPANPVINGSEIWKQLCTKSTDSCNSAARIVNGIFDEGTFDIVEKVDGWFYVTFHGYDGKNGYRGIARTRNFVDWNTSTPNGEFTDVLFDKSDLENWREQWNGGPIGVGHARILKEGNNYYTLIEGTDVNLGCTANQNWHVGFYRSSNLFSSNWQSYPKGNPIVYSSKWIEPAGPFEGSSFPCSVGYVGAFKDKKTGGTYIYYSRTTVEQPNTGIYIYKITPRVNILENGDLWRCDSFQWGRINGASQTTNLAVYRHPFNASDFNCHLATNCGGATCQEGQNVYIDVDLTSEQQKPSTKYRIESKIRVSSGVGKKMNIGIFQMDANNTVIGEPTNASVTDISNLYKNVTQDITLNNGVKKIRIGFYLSDAGMDYYIDEVKLIPVVSSGTTTSGGSSGGGSNGSGGSTGSNIDPSVVCPALDISATPDSRLTLEDFANFARWYGKSCTTSSITLSCGSVDVNKNGKVDLPDFAHFATYFASKENCNIR